MIQTMKRRKLRQYIERINSILIDRTKGDGQARSEAILLLNKIVAMPKVATAAALFNITSNPALKTSVELVANRARCRIDKPIWDKICGFLLAGNKIAAIKELRSSTGMGLKEAMNYITLDSKCVTITNATRVKIPANPF